MKKLLSLFLSVLIFLLSFTVLVFAKTSVQLKLTDASAYAGEEFTVKLFISDNSELSGAVIDLYYDSELLEFLSAEEGTIIDESASVNIKNFDKKSYVRFTYMSPSSSITSAGILLSVKFKARETAEGKTNIKLSVPNAGDFVNSKLEKIPFEVVNSNIRIINSTQAESDTTEIPSTESATETVTSTTELTSVNENTVDNETTTEITQDKDSNDNVGLKIVFVLFGTGLVLLSGVIVYVIISKKKKR